MIGIGASCEIDSSGETYSISFSTYILLMQERFRCEVVVIAIAFIAKAMSRGARPLIFGDL